MAGYAAQDEEVRQDIDHVDALQLTRDPDGQAFVGELVDDVEHPEPPPVVGALLDEVIGPHMIAMHWPQPDARAVRQPQSPAFGLRRGTLSPSRRQFRSTRCVETPPPTSSAAILR